MTTPQHRVFGLDLLRAFAVVSVVYAHGYNFLEHYLTPEQYTFGLFEGVNIFFTLSGFLIGRILLKTVVHEDFGAEMLREFWIRRWFRTLPNYFLVLLVLLAYYVAIDGVPDHLWKYFVFSQNLVTPHPRFFPEAWSLAVEEWFYLLIPIPLYLMGQVKRLDRQRTILWTILAVIVAVTVYRVIRAQSGFESLGDWDLVMRKQVFLRFDGLMFGVLGAYLSVFHRHRWEAHQALTMTIGVTLLIADKLLGQTGMWWYLNYFTNTITALAVLFMLPRLSTWTRKPDLITKGVTFISVISYSMYLLNLTVMQNMVYPQIRNICWSCLPLPGPAMYAVYWVTTIALSYVLYRCYEKPMTGLRDKWKPSRRASVEAMTPAR